MQEEETVFESTFLIGKLKHRQKRAYLYVTTPISVSALRINGLLMLMMVQYYFEANSRYRYSVYKYLGAQRFKIRMLCRNVIQSRHSNESVQIRTAPFPIGSICSHCLTNASIRTWCISKQYLRVSVPFGSILGCICLLFCRLHLSSPCCHLSYGFLLSWHLSLSIWGYCNRLFETGQIKRTDIYLAQLRKLKSVRIRQLQVGL